MKFDQPAGTNPIDQGRVVGRPLDRVDGPLKVCGLAPYAYERNDVAPNAAYGFVVASAIAKGRIATIDTRVWGEWLMYLAAVLTIWSMLYYMKLAWPQIRERGGA